MSSSPVIPTFTLNNNTSILALGFGTGTSWYKPDRFSAFNPDMVEMAKTAIAAGYRHLDTAEGYGTEAELGQAIKESGVPREELFISSKGVQSITEGNVEDLPKGVDESLRRLGLEYLDMYLIHSPYIKDNKYDEALVARAWALLESTQQTGKVRSIGVSNFRRTHITNLLKTAKTKPCVNQIQFHPYIQGAPEYAHWLLNEHDIRVEAWMGLAPITHLKGKHLEALLKRLSEKYEVGESAVLIRWMLDMGVVVLNTTKKRERIDEYFLAIGWELEEEDREEISSVGGKQHVRVPVGDLYDGGELGPY